MKPNTPELLKFKKLQRRLQVSVAQLVGHLELLWIATAKNAPRGDIGRFSNEDIAIACYWDGDPDELIHALVECRWLDVSESHRLVVHDWRDHAPTWVIGSLARHKKEICASETDSPKEPAKEVPKEAAKELAKEVPKEAAREAARHPPTSTSTSTSTSPILTNPNLTSPNQDYSSEPLQASEPVEASIVFELVGRTPGPWSPPISLLKQLQEYYPSLDVIDEVRRAAAWHHCNRASRKTQRGILKYLNNWLSKSNDQGSPGKRSALPQSEQRDLIKTWRRHD